MSGAGSVLRLEARRNITPLLLPVLALLLWFSPYGRSLGDPALWVRRSSALLESMAGIAPFMAGVAAWTGSRDGRRQTLDLMATTPVSGWRRALYGWAATTAWGLLFYAVAAAVLLVLTARDATWGGPSWWNVGVGAATIVAFSAAGHALGTLFPGRFVAPLTAICSFLVLVIGAILKSVSTPFGLVTPVGTPIDPDHAMFFRTGPAEAIVQLTFLLGVTAVSLGALGLRHRAGIALAAAGTVAAATGLWLAGSSTLNSNESRIFIPHLQRSATPREVSYTPVCDHSAIPVCVHPAYRKALGDVATALRPVTGQLAGLPGVPSRIDLRPDKSTTGSTVLYLAPPLDQVDHGNQIVGDDARELRAFMVFNVVGNGDGAAQQAVMLGILAAAGDPMDSAVLPFRGEAAPEVTSAARRFAALPAAQRRQWLAAHLDALQSGRLSLKDLP
ncbi:hypothetical protein J4573_01155 [Actinomadura barringtoniae]|uniref:Uncharacterized protein n=1 Tax=Actinomadura barringtoniae TaxID=1427535 RepID=A0A939T1Z8_9ACTN|nr:hypothetical protein [Actinomadura barringtoniae]MBO2445688.1 hypothetical protein [Actinomadura barringtoniae]